jgi:plastocyanin
MANQHVKKSNTPWIIAAVVVIIIIIVASVLAYQLSQQGTNSNITPMPSPSGSPVPSTGNVSITVYAGEVTLSEYGFGSTPSNITSPGPTFTVKAGTTVTVHFGNAGSMGHNWALVNAKTDGSTLLAFSKSQVASGTSPIPPAGQGTTTFIANQAGTYYYICQVDSHVSLGMWGYFIVTP